MRQRITIGRQTIEEGRPALLVAEIAQEHQGSYAMAHAMIVAAAQSGANAVKFQCHIAAAESTQDEAWRERPRWAQDENRYAYWKRMEFTGDQWEGLAAHAESLSLIFIVSPFSTEAVDLTSRFVNAWKVASGELVSLSPAQAQENPLFRKLVKTGKPILLSTGMSTEAEIWAAVQAMKQKWHAPEHVTGGGIIIPNHEAHILSAPYALLHCTSMYPTPARATALNLLTDLQASFDCQIGISDHSGTIWPAVAAAALGATIIELHVTFDKRAGGPDSFSAVTFNEFSQMVDGVRFVEAAGRPVDRNERAESMSSIRALFGERWKRVAPRA